MITKRIIAPLFIVILLAGIGGIVAAKKATERQAAKTSSAAITQTDEQEVPEPEPAQAAKGEGRYVEYDDQSVADESYDHTVLFFHASWCPECRAYDKAIQASGVPGGVQVLKVDYDKATDLKKKHGVTLQSTFASIDKNGGQLKKWVGYGKDKSVETILTNLQID